MNEKIKKGNIAEKGTISLQELISSIKSNPNFKEAGDIIIFSGVVRETSLKSPKKVIGIEIEAYDEVAEQQLEKICEKMIEEEGLIDVRLCHYKGAFSVGETLIHCLIASKHRKEGIDALPKIIEEYKKALIWKKEIYLDTTFQWVSENLPKF